MKYTTDDIRKMKAFAEDLSAACDAMLDGTPKTTALEEEAISHSIFYSIIKSLHRNEHLDLTDIKELKHPAWEDDLISDLGGDVDAYMCPNFEHRFYDLMEKYLDYDETSVTDLYYPNQKSIAYIAKDMEISESAVRSLLKSSLKKLAPHKDELFYGKDFFEKIDRIRTGQTEHLSQLEWIQNALDYLEDLGDESKEQLDRLDIPEKAKAFYRKQGLTTLADAMQIDPQELFEQLHTL